MLSPHRRLTREVRVGDLVIGGSHPILIQSMTIADPLDPAAVVEEIAQLAGAGCPLVRVTIPHVKAAHNLPEIRAALRRRGLRVPLVADIHFTPDAALIAAEHCEKVRVNPGNYADRKRFAVRDFTDAEYASELDRLRGAFLPLVHRLKETGAALRIGTNHGSLSDRIMNRYGDSPQGMVESALEFVRICESAGYRDIVLSMKSSIPKVMVDANRLLVARMIEEGMDYPIHLGVTEAGGGDEGRIKSAIGIGTLLCDGIGETIRVSLTEDSVHEIEACRGLLAAVERERGAPAVPDPEWTPPPPLAAGRRATRSVQFGDLAIGGEAPPRVEVRLAETPWPPGDPESAAAEASRFMRPSDPAAPLQVAEGITLLAGPTGRPSERLEAVEAFRAALEPSSPVLVIDWDLRRPPEIHALEPLLNYVVAIGATMPVGDRLEESRVAMLARLAARRDKPLRFRIETDGPAGPEAVAAAARTIADVCIEHDIQSFAFLLSGPGIGAAARAVCATLDEKEATAGVPVLLDLPSGLYDAAIAAGSALLDGLGDGLVLSADPDAGSASPVRLGYQVLQACRLRLTRAEFIACPSCGRTQFDLQETTRRIQEKTAHLSGVKIAIMGCIVNGPGEMADADFGYVGSAPGKVDLYLGRERIRQALPTAEADERLVELIREQGRWTDPPEEQ